MHEADIIIKNKNKAEKLKIKGKQGVYILIIDTICVYIGMSKNLYQRTSRFFPHIRTLAETTLPTVLQKLLIRSKNIELHLYFCTTIEEAVLLEQALIQEMHPVLNKHFNLH